MTQMLDALAAIARPDQLLIDEPMSRHTTMRVGGPADLLFQPDSEEQFNAAMAAAQLLGVPVLVIGNGSNLIVRDGGIRGLVIQLGEHFSSLTADGCVLTAQAGATLSRLAALAQSRGLTGLEFASGIPGTVGGGCLMNAGAYGGQISDVLLDARVWKDGSIQTLSCAGMALGYRTSRPMTEGGVVLSARFALQPGDPDAIQEKMRDLNQRRRDKQPLNYPSSGSTFKRPEGHFAGALIEGAGLKGFRVGGAAVSEKHAGFVVNVDGATASDVLNLIAEVQRRVLDHSGVRLEMEVRVVGEEACPSSRK